MSPGPHETYIRVATTAFIVGSGVFASLALGWLKRADVELMRLVRENEALVEIGQVISSTLDIDEVYERFANQVHKIISFDGIAISLLEPEGETLITAYMLGDGIALHWKQGNTYPLDGTLTQDVIINRRGMFFSVGEESEIANWPGSRQAFQAGYRSFLGVPLTVRDEVIGSLLILSETINVYGNRDMAFAERVADQIAGAIASAQLYAERGRAEEESRRLARENQELAEIGRIMTSSLDIDEVYQGFAEQVRRIIPSDRIDIVTGDLQRDDMRVEYVDGLDLDTSTGTARVFAPPGGFNRR